MEGVNESTELRRHPKVKYCYYLGGSPDLVVMGDDSRLKGHSNPSAVYWMDIFHIDLL